MGSWDGRQGGGHEGVVPAWHGGAPVVVVVAAAAAAVVVVVVGRDTPV